MPDCRSSLVTIATLVILLSVPTTAQQTSPTPPSGLEYAVAIVPPTNITGQPEDEWIGAGIAETLSADLQFAPLFTVIGRESVQRAMAELSRMTARETGSDTGAELLELGRRLGVRWVISGGYQRFGDQLRITAQMVEVATGAVVRSAKVDGQMASLFDLQDQVSRQLIAPPTTETRPEPPPRSAPQPPPLPDAPRPGDAGAVRERRRVTPVLPRVATSCCHRSMAHRRRSRQTS